MAIVVDVNIFKVEFPDVELHAFRSEREYKTYILAKIKTKIHEVKTKDFIALLGTLNHEDSIGE